MKKLFNSAGPASPTLSRKITYLLLLLVTLISSTSSAWADTYSISFNDGAIQTPESSNYFRTEGTLEYNTKYTGSYNDVTYTKGLKIQNSTTIKFTCTENSILTIVQSLTSNDTNYPKITGPNNFVKTCTASDRINDDNNHIGIYTIGLVDGGEYTISRISEYGLLYLKVEEGAYLGTIKSGTAPNITWDFSNITDAQAECMTDASMGSWVKVMKSNGTDLDYYGGPIVQTSQYWSPSWCDGIQLGFNQSSTQDNTKARIYINGSTKGYYLGGAAASMKVTIPTGANTLTVTSTNNAVTSGTNGVTFTNTGGNNYVAYVNPGDVVEVRRVGACYITQVATSYTELPAAPTATFSYGETVSLDIADNAMTIPVHATQAGNQITLNITPSDGATATLNTGDATVNANVLSTTAPAAGNNKVVKVDVTKDAVTTTYTLTINTLAKLGSTFNEETRYSQLLMNNRLSSFKANTTATSFGTYSNGTVEGATGKTELDYVPGLVAKAVIEAVDYYKGTSMASEADVEKWFKLVENYAQKEITSNGKDGNSLDDLNAVKLYFVLKELTKTGGAFENSTTATLCDTRMSEALSGISSANKIQSGTVAGSNGFDVTDGWWHKSSYKNQMWCDGQYMGPALLAQLNNADKKIDNAGDWDLITKQFTITWNMLWDNDAKLLYHAFAANGRDVVNSKETDWVNLSRVADKTNKKYYQSSEFWGRAEGWYLFGLVDVLEQMQIAGLQSTANYTTLSGYLTQLAAGIMARQDVNSGCWYQLLAHDGTFSANSYNSAAQPQTFNYLESSASSIFTAAFLKAMRLGLLPKTTYEEKTKAAYRGLIENFVDGNYNVLNCCRSAGVGDTGSKFRDGTAAYYLLGPDVAVATNETEGKALGAFIMAAVEYERLYLEDNLVTEITLDKTKAYIEYNTTTQLTATVLPDDAANKNINWSTSNETNVSVTNTGLVKGKYAYGATETITATAADGSGVTANCTVYVYRFGMTGTAKQDYIVGDNGVPTQIYTVFPDAGGNVSLNISDFDVTSSDEEIVSSRISSIIDNKLNMPINIGTKAGSATLTITYKGSNVNYYGKSCELTYTVSEGKSSNTTPTPSTGTVDAENKVITAPVVNNANESTRYTLGLPAGATATVTNAAGTSATIEDGVLVYNSPAAGSSADIAITITAENGTTNANYTVHVETLSAPVEDTTIFSMTVITTTKQKVAATTKSDAISNSLATIEGGSVYYYNSNGNEYEYISSQSQLKIGHNSSYVQIDLEQPLANGDIITFTEGTNQMCFTTTTTRNTNNSTVNNTYTVTEGDGLAGASTLYVWRTGSTPTIKTLNITRPAPKKHTVTFNINTHSASTIPANETESEIGAGVTLPKPTPFAGYTFLGWSTDQNATVADNDLWAYIDTYYPTQDVTLYAVYRQNPIGSQHTSFWHAFSDFIQLENGKAYNATFNNEGGDASYKNWVLIATKNANGHNGDGVQNDSSNEIFCLRADGGYWKVGEPVTTAGKVYRYNTTTLEYDEITAVGDADFVTDMSAGDASVSFSMSRVDNKLYLYAVTTCANDARYVQTFESDAIEGDVFLSYTTEFSKISSLNGNTNKAANLITKESGGLTQNGTVDDIVSADGISLTGKGVAEGTIFKVKTTADDGYELDAIYVNETGYRTSTEFPMPATEAVVGASFRNTVKATYNYTVNAVKSNGTIIKQITTGSCTEGDAVTVAYPQYVLDSSSKTLYGIRNNATDYYRTTFTPDQDNFVVNITYNYNNKENVVYYTEAEDISGFTATTGNVTRASNGAAARSNNTVTTNAVLSAGSYKIYFRSVNGDNARQVTFTDGSATLLDVNVAKADYSIKESAIFTLDSEKTIHVNAPGSTSSGLDWFFIQKINVLAVSQNEQKFGFTKENVEAYDYASVNAAGTSSSQTHDGVTGLFYNIKNTSNYAEISETNAIAFKVSAFHGNGTDTRTMNVYVDGENVGTINITPGNSVSSQVFAIPAPTNGIHTIKMTGNGADVYVADVVFYTQKTAPTVTPTNVSVNALQTKQFDVTASDGCTITNMNNVSSEYATVTYNDGKLTVQGIKEGSLDVTLNIDASGSTIFEGSTATVHINVAKADLVMRYSPDSYTVNAEEETPELPDYELKYYVIEDGEERELPSVPALSISYETDDSSVATVTNSGVIDLAQNPNGTADITATSTENDVFTSANASFIITITKGVDFKVSSKPSVTDGFEVKSKDGTKTLLFGTYGGWKRHSNVYTYNDAETGSKKDRTDDWKTVETYSNAIDGFDRYSSGVNDAMDEDMSPNSELFYGVRRNGWFESPLKLTSIDGEGKKTYTVGDTKPFSLPVRGTYMTFEPTVNGQLTIYILQNGAWNSLKDDVTDNDGYLVSVDENGKKVKFPGTAPWQFRPHSFHVVDQNGMPVSFYTDFKINTKQPIKTGIITEEQLNSKKDGKDVYTDAQKQLVRNFCETYGAKLGDKFKCITDPNEEGYNDVTNIGNWKEFKEYMSAGEQARVKDAWNTGVNGAQKVVEMDNGSFLAIDECIMKYSFYVAAGQTYYLFSNFSKMGFSGCNFVPDETSGSQPTVDLTLSEKTRYTPPTLNASVGAGNHTNNITVPQYRQITLDRKFNADTWNTIYLPFVMTEKEVRDVFGPGTQLLLLNNTYVDSDDKLNLEFIYHEIQSILPGYPYLIKPTKQVNANDLTVYNKLIQPDARELAFSFGEYSCHGTSGYCSADVAYSQAAGYNNYSARLDKGDIYMNGGSLYIVNETPVYSRGYRAYIDYVGSNPQQAAKRSISLFYYGSEEDKQNETPTYIDFAELSDEALEDLGIKTVMKGVYNLNGQKIAEKADNLPTGLYIINGKKVSIVKK